jgi:ribosomal protein S18 acetylase RimI-like enzyme
MEIRLLTADDAGLFMNCRLESLKNSPLAFGSTYEEWKDRTVEEVRERFFGSSYSPYNVIFGAFSEGPLAGIIGIRQEAGIRKAHKMSIWGMYVSRDFRKNKIGEKLMAKALEHARSLKGIERVDLTVTSTNAPAKNLYLKFGFKTWGVEPSSMKVDGQHIPEDYMSLVL